MPLNEVANFSEAISLTPAKKPLQIRSHHFPPLPAEMPLAPINFRGNPYIKNDKVKDFIIFPLGGAYFKYTDIVK